MMTRSELIFDPVVPAAYIAALAIALILLTWWAYWRVGSRLVLWQRVFLLAARLLGLLLILIILLQPSRRQEIQAPDRNRVLLVAVDTSRSMRQQDADGQSRLDFAAELVRTRLLPLAAEHAAELRLVAFDREVAGLNSVDELSATGQTTRFHTAVLSMLDLLAPDERAAGLILLSDGHDFELVNPERTAQAARARRLPVYALAIGGRGSVRDISVEIINYQPYGYVEQAFRIEAAVHQVGCEYERVIAELRREGEIVQTQQINLGDERETQFAFEVREPTTGQYEYTVRLRPIADEIEANNNQRLTFINVIDQRMRVLLLEGEPYWDTTFLRRSLLHNDKFELDAIVRYSGDRARRLRSLAGSEPLRVPEQADEWHCYDLVILGRAVDQLLDEPRREQLRDYVSEHGGALIFSRGAAVSGEGIGLEPVSWDEDGHGQIDLSPTRDGQPLAMLQHDGATTDDQPRRPILSRNLASQRSLTVTLAEAAAADGTAPTPGIVYRRQGRGQVVSIGVEGLWRWAFHQGVEPDASLFDRFWENLVLWLLAGGDLMPAGRFAFKASASNLPLGETLFLRLGIRNSEDYLERVPVSVYHEDKLVETLSLTAAESMSPSRLGGKLQPTQTGRYRAVAELPDGTTLAVRFGVFEDNPEDAEVAVDARYLESLCTAAGGRLLTPEELPEVAAELVSGGERPRAKVRLTPIWDRLEFCYLIVLCLALDWYWRRKWGLN